MSSFLSNGPGASGEIAGGYRTGAIARGLVRAEVPQAEREAMMARLRAMPDSTRWADRRDDAQVREVALAGLGAARTQSLLRDLRVRQELTGVTLASLTLLVAGALLAVG